MIKKFQRNFSLSEAKTALGDDGAIILEGIVCPDALGGELNPYFEAVSNSEGYFYGNNTKRFGGLIGKSNICRELALNQKVHELVGATLSPYCDCYQLNLTQAIEILSGETPQFLHKDDALFPSDFKMESMINVLWAVTDFTADNGATRLILGSHKWPLGRQPANGEVVSAEMTAGSCLIYVGSLFHGGGANLTNEGRKAAIISYNLGWLKQTENFFLSEPWEQVQNYPIELQRLLGYQLHRPNVGWVEGVDPLDWIKAGRPSLMGAKDALTDEQLAVAVDMKSNSNKYSAYLQ